MSTPTPHTNYRHLVDRAARCHDKGRTPADISASDVALARLYSYAFRLHTIGAFHATRLAILACPSAGPLSAAHRLRAVETIQDLADQGMEPIPLDFRALLSTFYRYHRGTERVALALRADLETSQDAEISDVLERYEQSIGAITSGNGIHLTRDTHAPEQASFVVPALGITIVPLIYGDHHSWNLAYLGGARSDVPFHRHHDGVEIHLGYGPLHGFTVLGDHAAEVTEGYAMPIPPMTRHGYTNVGDLSHHVPFIFGSLQHGGWGVFLDVESQPAQLSDLKVVKPEAPAFSQMVYLEREIAAAARSAVARRWTLIPASVTNRNNSGGLELSIMRVTPREFQVVADTFLAVSVVRGAGTVVIAGQRKAIGAHDHFCIPAGLPATLSQTGDEALVLLDAAIRDSRRYR